MTPKKLIVGGAILDSLAAPSKLLAARRSAPPELAGLWEFPGGKIEVNELAEDALHRELSEELGITVRLGGEVVNPGNGGWPLNANAEMRVWLVEVSDGTPAPLEDHDELRWVSLVAQELESLAWIPADFPIVEAVRRQALADMEL